MVHGMKWVAISTITVLAVLALATWSNFRDHILPFPATGGEGSAKSEGDPSSRSDVQQTFTTDVNETSTSLGDYALNKVLEEAAPIFGLYENVQNNFSKWMAAYPDSTLLVHMNLPGAHDAATWVYSAATQKQNSKITDLVNDSLHIDNENFRCQDRSLVDMLDAGIRVFDLRYAFDVTNSTIVFWHSVALLSETATLDSVLFGFYRWLDDHPTEAVLISLQYEAAGDVGNVDSAKIQKALYRILTSDVAKQYINQARDELGMLGDARGKITLLRRFDLDKLPQSYSTSLPGLHFSPKKWIVNGINTELIYNKFPLIHGETGKAYIQDYYQPRTDFRSSLAENIEIKMTKIVQHFDRAAGRFEPHPDHGNSLYWNFASATNIWQDPAKTPKMMALGEEGVKGINEKLVDVLGRRQGQRLGIVMFDFFEQPSELRPLFLGLLTPEDMEMDAKT